MGLLFHEMGARNEFSRQRLILETILTKAQVETPIKVKAAWLHDAEANPSIAAFRENYPEELSTVGSVIVNDESHVYDYLNQSRSWEILYFTPSPTGSDLSWVGTTVDKIPRQDRVNVKVIFSRRMLSIFRQDPIQIIVKPAPDNDLLIGRLKAGFAENNLPYDIQE